MSLSSTKGTMVAPSSTVIIHCREGVTLLRACLVGGERRTLLGRKGRPLGTIRTWKARGSLFPRSYMDILGRRNLALPASTVVLY
jgi:hypothetical protein